MRKLFVLIIGAWIAVIGVYLIIGKDYYLLGIKVGFDKVNFLVGLLFLFIGIWIFIFGLKTEAKDFEERVTICSRCAQPLDMKELVNMRCPKCGGKLEDLDGYFERHPEHKKR